MIKDIWHTSFTVENIERSIEFYRDILNLELVHEQVQHNEYTAKLVNYPNAHLKVAMFAIKGGHERASGHVVELVEYVYPKGEYVPTGTAHTRSAHLAFEVEDIFAMVEKLKNAGVRFKSDVVSIEAGRNKGGYTVYFFDPDDITLELVQPPK
ncbi:VOC family protein [Metasolibacillus sp. FSL H7-0170]|uniref:VOC family protein n=1 Tax=Metasolibacillus TaxID=2703677 RepID=UPI000D3C4ACF|nr:VOC family protein [Metasolibacillus fluoroglycofenilyticus]